MPKKVENPFKMGYDSELDTSPVLSPYAASYYLAIIDVPDMYGTYHSRANGLTYAIDERQFKFMNIY